MLCFFFKLRYVALPYKSELDFLTSYYVKKQLKAYTQISTCVCVAEAMFSGIAYIKGVLCQLHAKFRGQQKRRRLDVRLPHWRSFTSWAKSSLLSDTVKTAGTYVVRFRHASLTCPPCIRELK